MHTNSHRSLQQIHALIFVVFGAIKRFRDEFDGGFHWSEEREDITERSDDRKRLGSADGSHGLEARK